MKCSAPLPAFLSLAVFTLSLLLQTGCGNTIELTSSRTAAPLLIDGKNSEWAGDLVRLKKPPVSIGFQNDTDHLYLCLATADRFIQAQILFGGLTVWFESDDPGETFGVQFPRPQEQPRPPEEPFEAIFRAFEPRMHSLLILRGGNREEFSLMELKGIDVRVGVMGNILVYELRVPLHKASGSVYAVIPPPDNTLKVRIESVKPDRVEMTRTDPRGPGRKSEDAHRPEHFQLSLKVRLTP